MKSLFSQPVLPIAVFRRIYSNFKKQMWLHKVLLDVRRLYIRHNDISFLLIAIKRELNELKIQLLDFRICLVFGFILFEQVL